MPTTEPVPWSAPKPKTRSKRVWGFLGLVVTVGAMVVGEAPERVAFLADGFQAGTDLVPLAALVSAFVAVWGVFTAKQRVLGLLEKAPPAQAPPARSEGPGETALPPGLTYPETL